MILKKAELSVKKGDDQISLEKPNYLDAACSYGEAIDTLYWLKRKE